MKKLIILFFALTSGMAMAQTTSCKEVRVRLDLSYDLYRYFAGTEPVKDDSSDLINNTLEWYKGVVWLYDREGIKIKPHIGKIWRTNDSISSAGDGSRAMYKFAMTYCNKPIASTFDLAQFIDRRSGLHSYSNFGYLSGLNRYCQQFSYICPPVAFGTKIGVYNETVKIAAHEMGHNLGSWHTQHCGWVHPNGYVGPIDSCSQPEPISTTTPVCKIKRQPNKKGTIMSYCDFDINGGIDFQKGFGPLPGDKIRKTLEESTIPCVGTPPPTPCTFTYTNFGPCQPNGTQTRTELSRTPSGCTGTPLLIQPCTYVPPVTPIVKLTPLTRLATGKLYAASYPSNKAFDGIVSDASRWLTCDTATISETYQDKFIDRVELYNGYGPTQTNTYVMVWVDDQFVFGTASNQLQVLTIPINRSNVRKIVCKTFGAQAAGCIRVSRVREWRVFGF